MSTLADPPSRLDCYDSPNNGDVTSKRYLIPQPDQVNANAVKLRRISLSYSNNDSHASALRLILTLKPEWEKSKETIEFVRFTDGITNTLLKAVNRLSGLSQHEIDQEAILLRAYGKGTDVLIDRDRETTSHSLLAAHRLAPPLLARFQNGLLYRFIEGTVCQPEDLRRKEVWRAVARRMGEWHAILPVSGITSSVRSEAEAKENRDGHSLVQDTIHRMIEGETDAGKVTDGNRNNYEDFAPNATSPSVWTVIHKWIDALPSSTEAEKDRKALLAKELRWVAGELGDMRGIDGKPFIFAHCDLLSGNVIVLPRSPKAGTKLSGSVGSSPEHGTGNNAAATPQPTATVPGDSNDEEIMDVGFIDYEYATAAPSAFDIANHFAEWGGFACDFSVLPTRVQRLDFLRSYLTSYYKYSRHSENGQGQRSDGNKREEEDTNMLKNDLEKLSEQIDAFRGLPGFYWGIWALIQAMISQIDFDYASYAEIRLSEYWAWKAEWDGSREEKQTEMPLRERRWRED